MAPRTRGYIRFNNVPLITRHARQIGTRGPSGRAGSRVSRAERRQRLNAEEMRPLDRDRIEQEDLLGACDSFLSLGL